MKVSHRKTSPAADNSPPSVIGPNAWNEDHRVVLGVNEVGEATYTLTEDDNGSGVSFTVSCVVTLPLFERGWFAIVQGPCTITPTGCLIAGQSSLTIAANAGFVIWSTGTGYRASGLSSAVLGLLSTLSPAANFLPYFDTDHSAAMALITPFARTLLGKANASAVRDELEAAGLASPAFTGAPTAPTPDSADNSTKLATTEYVRAAVAALVNSAPDTLDTLQELADALGDDPDFATTVVNALATKAPLASPALTGAPTAPTVVSSTDSSTKVATTAFVQAAIANASGGAARVGTSVLVNQSAPIADTLVEDGASYSSTTYAALFAALVRHSTVTITIATPGVVTWNGHKLKANDPVKFVATGTLPTGLTAGTIYYAVGASITTNTFQVSATAGGAAISTSGTQSGTHTAINAPHGCANDLSTFNVPNTLGEFIRGWDAGRGVDSNRSIGSFQSDDLKSHLHNYSVAKNYGSTSGTAYANSAGTGWQFSVNNETTTATGGSETRPRNVAKLPCIYYQ